MVPDGGAGTTGAAGTSGRAGTGGAAGGGSGGTSSGGAGGGGCAAQLKQPVMFHEGMGAPVSYDSGRTRYYWIEYGNPYITVHYSPGSPTASDTLHPLRIDASVANTYNVAASNDRVAAAWGLQGIVAAYGPDDTSTQLGMLTLTNPGAVTVNGTGIYLSQNPMGGNPTPGIYSWNPPSAPVLFESFAQLGGDWTLGLMLRTTPFELLFSDRTDVWQISFGGGTPQRLFANPGNGTILDIRVARPHLPDGAEGGVIVEVQDRNYTRTGHDYYVNVLVPGSPPVDLAAAVDKLADVSACGADARYHGTGVLFIDRYIYEGQGGLFMVDLMINGSIITNLTRLTDQPFSMPEITGYGDLFAGQLNTANSKWDYYRVGNP